MPVYLLKNRENSEAEVAAAITSTCISMGGFTAEILMGSAFELGNHFANIGGTVIVGNDRGVELNTNSTHLMRAEY